MPISCEDLAEQMAILEDELAACNQLIADINAALLVEPDPMVRMMLTMELGQALNLRAEIEFDIAIVRMNQELLGCVPPSTAAVAGVGNKQIELHERLRKLQVSRFVRKNR